MTTCARCMPALGEVELVAGAAFCDRCAPWRLRAIGRAAARNRTFSRGLGGPRSTPVDEGPAAQEDAADRGGPPWPGEAEPVEDASGLLWAARQEPADDSEVPTLDALRARSWPKGRQRAEEAELLPLLLTGGRLSPEVAIAPSPPLARRRGPGPLAWTVTLAAAAAAATAIAGVVALSLPRGLVAPVEDPRVGVAVEPGASAVLGASPAEVPRSTPPPEGPAPAPSQRGPAARDVVVLEPIVIWGDLAVRPAALVGGATRAVVPAERTADAAPDEPPGPTPAAEAPAAAEARFAPLATEGPRVPEGALELADGGAASPPELRESPSLAEVAAALGPTRSLLRNCVSDETSALTVDLAVEGATGRVWSARVLGPLAGSAEGRCVERALGTAQFPTFSDPSFVLRSYAIRLR